MLIFETILALLIGATILSAVAQRIGVPYPTILAIGGACVAVLPEAPRLAVPPDLIMTLFVAPVLMDAAHDSSPRDLRDNWLPILSLVFGAVILTTVAVAAIAHEIFPDFPWAAALALGALLAPPDAVAALAVLGQLNPPHRIRVILEGESLLNDASALLLYKLAVAAVAVASFQWSDVAQTFLLVVLGGALVGRMAAWPTAWASCKFTTAPGSAIFQFVSTFSLWLLAEHLGLSGVVTIVVFALTMAQRYSSRMPAHLRIPSFAIWQTITAVLNVLAFTLIGLQIRPILETLDGNQRLQYIAAALVIVLSVVIVRIVWVYIHHFFITFIDRLVGNGRNNDEKQQVRAKGGLVVAWSGMRGIVTLAAAMALPAQFPYRDFIQLTAFTVVLGTLVVQGGTLRLLLSLLKLPADETVAQEIRQARIAALKAALDAVDQDDAREAPYLRHEYETALDRAQLGLPPPESALRLKAMGRSRQAIEAMRRDGTIGDDAYRHIEAELDWHEMHSLHSDSDRRN